MTVHFPNLCYISRKRIYKERENQKRIKNWGQGILSRNFVTKNKRKGEFGSRVKRQMMKISACLYDLEMTEWKNWFGQGKNVWSNRGTEFTVQLGDSTETWLGIAHLREQMDEGLTHDNLEMLRCHWKPRGHESKTNPGGASGKQGVMKAKPRRPMFSSYLQLPSMRKKPHQRIAIFKIFSSI